MKKIKEILYSKRTLIIILISVFVTIAINISLNIDRNVIDGKSIKKLLNIFENFFNSTTIKDFTLLIGVYFIISKTFLVKNDSNKGKIYKIILSILFSTFTIIGINYSKLNNWNMIFSSNMQICKSIIVFIGYYILYRGIINYLFDYLLVNIKYKKTNSKLIDYCFEKHSFIIPLIIILVCWLPYIIAYFPGIICPDSSNQIKQFFGIDLPIGSATDSVKLIDENVKITNHHPVLHTVILGICMNIGKTINNDNIGIFIYTTMQVILLGASLAYIINFMSKIKSNNYIRIFTLVIFAILPIFPIYALQITKDVPFTAFFILYIINLYELIKDKNNKIPIKKALYLFIISMLLCFTRNNGIYVIIFSLPFLCIIDKVNRKKLIVVCMLILLINKCFLSVVLPALKIPTKNTREMLSIPFQQTARYVREHSDEITEEEKNIIDKVLIYDTLGKRYNPVHADSVKNEYNKESTGEDLKNYFKVWSKQLLKHPDTYIQATLNNYYGYFYLDSTITEFTVKYTVNNDPRLNKTGLFDYHYYKKTKGLREVSKQLLQVIQKVPVISWITNIALNTWIVFAIITYLLYRKKYKYIIYIMPVLSIILVCCASPVNAYFRYAMPYIFSMPLIISIFLDIIKPKEEGEEINEK